MGVLGTPIWHYISTEGVYKDHGGGGAPLSSLRISIFPFMDDWLNVAGSKTTLLNHLNLMMHLLQSLGICINHKKNEPYTFSKS